MTIFATQQVRTELPVSNLIGFPSKECPTAKPAKPAPAPKRGNATCTPMLRSSYAKTGPSVFKHAAFTTEKTLFIIHFDCELNLTPFLSCCCIYMC